MEDGKKIKIAAIYREEIGATSYESEPVIIHFNVCSNGNKLKYWRENMDDYMSIEEVRLLLENEQNWRGVTLRIFGVKFPGVLDHRDDDGICATYSATSVWLKEKDYGKSWYVCKKEEPHIDREAWISQWVYSMPVLGAGDLETRCASCGNLVLFETPFCPYCGKAMTKEAWEELERRLKNGKTC